MRAIAGLILVFLPLAVGACGPRITLDGQIFHGTEAALDHIEELTHRAMVEPVTPLSSPIGGPVIIVGPPQSHLRAIFRSDYPYQPAEAIDYAASGEAIFHQGFVSMIERRNLFESVSAKRATTPAGIDVPASGYLIWDEYTSSSEWFIHIIAAGESETTNLDDLADSSRITDGESGLRAIGEEYLRAIEQFVKTHRPSA
ncbi:MAG: hypothetical protein GY791_04600 [Alphaproteobacteria bacterium]|nr:hypothetical protein [Alphaproteobacteria bacterium]